MTILKCMNQTPIQCTDDYFSLFRKRHPDSSASFSASAVSGASAVMSVVGVLDGESSPDFLEGALASLASLPEASILELRLDGIKYITSTGVAALTRLLAAAEGRAVGLHVSGMSPSCQDVFSVLGLLDYFNITGAGSSPAPE